MHVPPDAQLERKIQHDRDAFPRGERQGCAVASLQLADGLLSQLGPTPTDPGTPLALSADSYTGTWAVRDNTRAPGPLNGATVFIKANGGRSRRDRASATFEACTVTVTNPATGAFTFA